MLGFGIDVSGLPHIEFMNLNIWNMNQTKIILNAIKENTILEIHFMNPSIILYITSVNGVL